MNTLRRLERMAKLALNPIMNKQSNTKEKDYVRKSIRNGQLLEQRIGDHDIVVKYTRNEVDIDEFIITYPRTQPYYDKMFETLDEMSGFHSKMLGLNQPPSPWKTFKIVAWRSVRTIYPTASIENLPPLPRYILEKDAAHQLTVKKETTDARDRRNSKYAEQMERLTRKAAERKQRAIPITITITPSGCYIKIAKVSKNKRRLSSGAASFMSLRGVKI
jgi:hypothetical protein